MKLKILMVTMGLEIGGAETHVMELCRALAAMGHEIIVASKGGVYESKLTECGIRHVTLPLNTKRPMEVLRSYNGLYHLIQTEKPDLVHAHARIPAFICSLIRKRLDFRFVTTAHLDFRTTALLKKISDWGDRTIAVSADIKQYLIDNYGVCADNITLTINGIDTAAFAPRSEMADPAVFDRDKAALEAEFSLEAGRKRILYISRIDTDRSAPAHHLCEIAPALDKTFGADIVIVGGGNDFDRLKEAADRANAEIGRRAVILTGGRSDISRFFSIADVMVGVSRSALEAMSAAVPVILAGNQGYLGIFEKTILTPAVDTNFCCRGAVDSSPERLLRDLEKLLSASVDELTAMGAYNRALILKEYSAQRMAQDYIDVYKEMTPYHRPRHSDIVISGYYGFSNTGDDSLLSSIIAGIREADPTVSITALTRTPEKMFRRFGVKCISRIHVPAILREFSKAKLLISGGGSLLQDTTSTKSLLYYTAIMKMANLKKLPVMIYANGIGPLSKESNRRRAKKAVEAAHTVTLRERSSLEELASMGVDVAKIRVTADPAFMIQPASDNRVRDLAAAYGMRSDRRYFTVSLREWTQGGDFESAAVEAVRKIMQDTGLYPVFVPMQLSRDYAICARVMEKCGDGGVMLASPDSQPTAAELMGLLKKTEFVIGMRLHVIIFATAAGVPCVGLAYDPKVSAVMEYVGQPAVLELKGLDADKIVASAEEVLANRAAISDAVKQRAAELREIAKEDCRTAVGIVK